MIDAGRIKRVLVIKPSSLGDIIHLFPALAELHRRLPGAELDFLVAPAFADILDYSPWPVAETILFERKKLGAFRTMVPEFLRLVRNLRRRRYNLILDFQGLTRSALFAFLAKGGPVVGFAAPREKLARGFYRFSYPVPPGHAIERYVNLVGALFHDPCAVELPELPEHRVDLIYLCYPNNPTGTTLTHAQLKKWVDYALANDTLIVFDAAYEAFITEPDVPHSIYEIRGAKKVAIEIRSFSKTAGFTGVRCGYTVVPKEVTAATLEGERIALNPLWNRRQCTKFNGTSYITQRGAEAVYSAEGQRQVKDTIAYYQDNARSMREGLQKMGFQVFGGVNAPYLWVKAPEGMTSWKFFDRLLYEAHLVVTPGVGFGPSGEGYVRLTAFGTHEDCTEAMERIRKWA